MTDHVIKHTVEIVSANGVFVTEFDCEVECTVRGNFGAGDPSYSINGITVKNGLLADCKVVDLLDRTSGLYPLGEMAKEILGQDKDFEAKVIDEFYDCRDHWGNAADARRAVVMAE